MTVIKLKKRKLVTSLVLSLGILFSISSSASAATTVTLQPSQSQIISQPIGLQKLVVYNAKNYNSSKHRVYAIVNETSGGKGWLQAGSTLMGIGQSCSGSYSERSPKLWNIELNPYGWNFKECSAWGKIQ